ncbi:MAG: hypothetical protein HOP02_15525 [Methylococcaceae bacterium]|nr:hypothetical protein [Methylococcaceae bacterium]
MKFKLFFLMLLLALLSSATVYAAGGPVNEDFAPLFTLSQNMITLSKQEDTEGFMKLARQALTLTAENYNNSMALTQVSGKFRAAKKAVSSGKFKDAIYALEDAQKIMQRKRVLGWDGGSE